MKDPDNSAGASEMTKSIEDQIPASIAILGIVCVIGSIGNLLVLYLYAIKNDKQTSTLFILVLAAADSLACTIIIPYTIIFEYLEWQMPCVYFCWAYYLLNSSGIVFSCLLISAIAFDRYFCICHPFLQIMTLRRAKVTIAILSGLALIVGVLSATQIKLVEMPKSNSSAALLNESYSENVTHVSSYQCVETVKGNQRKNTLFETVVFHVIQKIQTFVFLICIIVVIGLYICIYRSVLKVRKKRQEMKGLRKSGNPSKALLPKAASNESLKLNVLTVEAASTSQTDLGVKNNESSNSLNVSNSELNPRIQKTAVVKPKDSTNFQNFKTAMMLFVVAVVYIVCFLPASLMSNKLINLYLPVFYMYYCNSAANPIIYCFMNKNFRDDIKKIFCQKSKTSNNVSLPRTNAVLA